MLQTAAFLWVYATDLRREGKHGGTHKQPFPTQPDLRQCTPVLFRTLPGQALPSQAGIGRHVPASTSKTSYQKDVRQDVRRIHICKKTHLVSRCTPRCTPHIYMSKPAKGIRQDLRHIYVCKKQWVRQLRPDMLTYPCLQGFGTWPYIYLRLYIRTRVYVHGTTKPTSRMEADNDEGPSSPTRRTTRNNCNIYNNTIPFRNDNPNIPE